MKLLFLIITLFYLSFFTKISLAEETEKRGLDEDVSIHICPVENWNEYEIKRQNYIEPFEKFHVFFSFKKKTAGGTLFVTWPTNDTIFVSCGKNEAIIKTTLDSTFMIISDTMIF